MTPEAKHKIIDTITAKEDELCRQLTVPEQLEIAYNVGRDEVSNDGFTGFIELMARVDAAREQV